MRRKNQKNRKQKLRRAGILVLAATILLGGTQLSQVYASTIRDATDKKNQVEEELEKVTSNISELESEQATLRQEIDALDAELVDVIMNLSILESELSLKDEALIQIQADLAQAQADEATQYEAMKKRIQFMYERGDTAFLTTILESKSITDLLNRVEYFNEVYDYDRELLVAYQTVKLQVADLGVQVEGEIAELEELQANYQEEQQRYETMIAQKKSDVADFDVQLTSAKQLAEEYQKTIEKQNEIIRQAEEDERRRQEEEAERQRQEELANQTNNNSNNGVTGNAGVSSTGGNLNPSYTTGVSGSEVVNYACTFIGNAYVWGGTDPNTGADCSGFIQYVYRQYGVSLPRTSYEQRTAGQEVSYSNAQPGDIICYSGHVAIYMGNGQIVHASSSAPYPVGGIKTGTATYRTIISVRRVL